MSNDNKARKAALLKALEQLESRGFFGEVVVRLSNGVLGPRIDVREVVELDKAPHPT